MKSYGTTPAGEQFETLVIPSTKTIPRGAAEGQVIHLVSDLPTPENPQTLNSWYPKGTYIYNGLTWDALNDVKRESKSSIIGSQIIEIEKRRTLSRVSTIAEGVSIASLQIKPTNKRSSLTGHGSFWGAATKDCNVWITVYRNTKFVTTVLSSFVAHRPQTFSFSFYDLPIVTDAHTYTVYVYADAECELMINQSRETAFDGGSHTVFSVSENT